ncbi:hypothetical protein M885DRAFT_478031 [Pelagophyceae sp. CCMP2097]|nr:hypothetical protein M885DRAFT_478031 [Pelagophyceae sp. CCMP2097]
MVDPEGQACWIAVSGGGDSVSGEAVRDWIESNDWKLRVSTEDLVSAWNAADKTERGSLDSEEFSVFWRALDGAARRRLAARVGVTVLPAAPAYELDARWDGDAAATLLALLAASLRFDDAEDGAFNARFIQVCADCLGLGPTAPPAANGGPERSASSRNLKVDGAAAGAPALTWAAALARLHSTRLRAPRAAVRRDLAKILLARFGRRDGKDAEDPVAAAILASVLVLPVVRASGAYDARARRGVARACAALGYDATWLCAAERAVAAALISANKAAHAPAQGANFQRGNSAKGDNSYASYGLRIAKVGGVAVGAGAVIALTAGMAAPVIAGVLASSSIWGATLLITAATYTTVFAATFGVAGGGLAGYRMQRRVQGLTDFEFAGGPGAAECAVKGRAEEDHVASLTVLINVAGSMRDVYDYATAYGFPSPAEAPLDRRVAEMLIQRGETKRDAARHAKEVIDSANRDHKLAEDRTTSWKSIAAATDLVYSKPDAEDVVRKKLGLTAGAAIGAAEPPLAAIDDTLKRAAASALATAVAKKAAPKAAVPETADKAADKAAKAASGPAAYFASAKLFASTEKKPTEKKAAPAKGAAPPTLPTRPASSSYYASAFSREKKAAVAPPPPPPRAADSDAVCRMLCSALAAARAEDAAATLRPGDAVDAEDISTYDELIDQFSPSFFDETGGDDDDDAVRDEVAAAEKRKAADEAALAEADAARAAGAAEADAARAAGGAEAARPADAVSAEDAAAAAAAYAAADEIEDESDTGSAESGLWWWNGAFGETTGDKYVLVWERDLLVDITGTMNDLAKSLATSGAREALMIGAAATTAAALLTALALPLALVDATKYIASTWTLAVERADAAGVALADALTARDAVGARPVTLVGYSLGARVVLKCLEELARRHGAALEEENRLCRLLDEQEAGAEEFDDLEPAAGDAAAASSTERVAGTLRVRVVDAVHWLGKPLKAPAVSVRVGCRGATDKSYAARLSKMALGSSGPDAAKPRVIGRRNKAMPPGVPVTWDANIYGATDIRVDCLARSATVDVALVDGSKPVAGARFTRWLRDAMLHEGEARTFVAAMKPRGRGRIDTAIASPPPDAYEVEFEISEAFSDAATSGGERDVAATVTFELVWTAGAAGDFAPVVAASRFAGIVEHAVLLGGPVRGTSSKKDRRRWQAASRMVAGRLVNAYSTNDLMLAVMFRSQSFAMHVGGLSPIKLPGYVEDLDVSHLVKNHGDYSLKIKELMQRVDLADADRDD